MDGIINILEVAKKAGVSKSTVSRVINDTYGVSTEAREKVLKAMDELKYRPNIYARTLRSKAKNLLGILITKESGNQSITHFVNSEKISGIVKKCSDEGFDVLIFIEDTSDYQRLNNIIIEKGLSGIILINRVPVQVLESFRSYNIPFVLVNWFAPGYEHQCYVKTDLSKATELALDLLTSRGYRDIGVINWEDGSMNKPVIENTFVNYMKRRDLNYKDCVWNTVINPPLDELTSFLKKSRKRAYISFCYYSSIRIIEFCRLNRISMPSEIALISYEFISFFDYLEPRLTGIKQQVELMGEKAAEKLIRMVNGDKNVESELLIPELIVRDSC